MEIFWINFTNRGSACIEAKDEPAALEEAAKHGTGATVAGVLPYPREPRLGTKGGCPSFCWGPIGECLGKTACPRNRACND